MLINGKPVSSKNALPAALTDYAGLSAHNTIFGETTVGNRRDYISSNFNWGVSTRDGVKTTTGTGAIGKTADPKQASLASFSTGVGVGSAEYITLDSIRYRAGHEIVSNFTAAFENAQAGVDSKIGLGDTDNRLALGFQGTVFGIWHKNGGTETFIPQSEWNGNRLDGTADRDEFFVDWAGLNVFKLQLGYLGIAPIVFSMYCGFNIGWQVLHVIDLTNKSPAITHVSNPFLKLQSKIQRASGSGTNARILTGSWRGGVIGSDGEDNSSDRWNVYSVTGKTLATGRNNIFTLKNIGTFNGTANAIRVQMAIVSIAVDGNKSIEFRATKNAIVTGSYADIDTANSVVQVLVGGAAPTNGVIGAGTVHGKVSSRRDDVRGTGFYMRPNETLTFEAVPEGAFTGTVSLSVRWIEEF